MSAPTAIATQELTKNYGELVAVDRVSFTVPAGSIFGLLGPNGAGKTTIIKVLTGLSDLTAGSASVAGYDVRRDPMHVKQRVGWVAAEVTLDDDLSGWQNLWLQAQLQRLDDWQGRAEQLLQYFDLAGRKKDKVQAYSTGMRKKLEIALALLHQPEVIFMDEPTIGLDPNVRHMLWDLIQGVNKQFGVTILLTSHYIEEAERLCDRVALLHHGRIAAVDTPAALASGAQARQHVSFVPSAPLDDEALRVLPGVGDVSAHGERVTVSGTGDLVGVLMTELVRRHVVPMQTRVQQSSLDDAFVAMTDDEEQR
jgi:ABC-2 type transport system ATP-binding protein